MHFFLVSQVSSFFVYFLVVCPMLPQFSLSNFQFLLHTLCTHSHQRSELYPTMSNLKVDFKTDEKSAKKLNFPNNDTNVCARTLAFSMCASQHASKFPCNTSLIFFLQSQKSFPLNALPDDS